MLYLWLLSFILFLAFAIHFHIDALMDMFMGRIDSA